MSNAAKTVAKKSLKGFIRKEDGNIATFSVLLFALMVMCGGLAVDLMRYEHTRTALQQTLDRCTLSAAQLKQTLDRKAVCQDYVAKVGLAIPASSIQVTGGTATDTFATVQVSTQIQMPTIFAGMLGIPKFDVPARSSATQAVTNVEIALVLDVSGSMVQAPNQNRLPSLKAAAKAFTTTVLANDSDNRTSIAIVPYNGQVNLGPVLAAKYNIVDQHGQETDVNCVDLPPSIYNTNGISRTLALPQTGFVDAFQPTESSYNATTKVTTYFWRNIHRSSTDANQATPISLWCPKNSGNIVRLPNNVNQTLNPGTSNEVPGLHAHIDGLIGTGATSINAGMKWGMAMLDPANRPMFNQLQAAGKIPATLSGRPFDYTVPGTQAQSMKIIVLMTDGEHFRETRLNDGYRTGNSGIWLSNDGIYSVRHTSGRPSFAGTNEFFIPSRCSASSSTPTANVSSTCAPTAWTATAQGISPVQLTWPEVWKRLRVSYVAWQFYARALGTDHADRVARFNTKMNLMRTEAEIADMDAQLQLVCNQARNLNVVVYGIAFEAPAGGRTQIQNCATSMTHYYEASTLNVAATFQSIAARISQLRLTQ
ncbi:MAG: pilus assembly protein TadG-related protein [Paracoccaceae bacterium]